MKQKRKIVYLKQHVFEHFHQFCPIISKNQIFVAHKIQINHQRRMEQTNNVIIRLMIKFLTANFAERAIITGRILSLKTQLLAVYTTSHDIPLTPPILFREQLYYVCNFIRNKRTYDFVF